MALVKPTIGQTAWGTTLNTALDYLDTNSLKVSTRNPIVSSNTDIVLTLENAGTLILVTKDENNYSQGFVVPTNAEVAFPVGTVITFATIDTTIWLKQRTHEASGTSASIYGEGWGTGTNWMGISNTRVAKLIKLSTNDWILSGSSINWD